MTLVLSLHFFTGGIFPGVYTILAVDAPRTNIHDSGRTCFVGQGRDEFLGFEWGIVWVSIDLLSPPEDLVQASALFSPWLPLGPISLLLAGNVFSVGDGVSV